MGIRDASKSINTCMYGGNFVFEVEGLESALERVCKTAVHMTWTDVNKL